MSKTIYSDNTDINGVNYATIGENIREGAKNLSYETVEPVLEDNKVKINDTLETDASSLKKALSAFLSDNVYYEQHKEILFGGSSVPPYTRDECRTFINVLINMNVDAVSLKNSLLSLLTGKNSLWGYTTVHAFTEEEKQQIKTYLGIN